jgi:hypothetical protein
MDDFRALDTSTLISAASATPKNAGSETQAAMAIAATNLMASSKVVVVIVVVIVVAKNERRLYR